MDKVSAIILAAGSGSRFGEKKQFKKLNDKPIWVYSLNTFIRSECVDELILVIPNDSLETLKKSQVFASLNEKNISISESPITAKKLGMLIDSISSGIISGRTAKEVFEIMKETGEDPKKIIESKGLQQKSDPKELEKIIESILSDNKEKVEQYKSGKDKLFGFFVGQVMKVSGGKANPQLVNEILKKKL